MPASLSRDGVVRKLSKRRLWMLGAIAIAVIALLTLFLAPSASKQSAGSTYSRSPDGYGAWYAFMEKRGTPVQRWKKPLEDLLVFPTQSSELISQERLERSQIQNPITLVQVNSQMSEVKISKDEKEWLKKGNTLVILGVPSGITEAAFTTRQESAAGPVKIETRRRRQLRDQKNQPYLPVQQEGNIAEPLLGDGFGAVVWQQKIGKGRLVWSVTPHLAANAYQDEPGNYQFLAQLLAQDNNKIWVDEYIHGYQELSADQGKKAQHSLLSYLANTPLFPVILQTVIVLIIAILAANRRFGVPQSLGVPVVDNSEAYIKATAGILEKANSSEFVLDIVGKEEQIQLQKALGLGAALLEPDSLINAWVQQTGQPPIELEKLLHLHSQKRRIREKELLSWLSKWQTIRRNLG
ncbi:DUF4350 domain-containing protein [Microcoleus sp. FACHB-672]|uniref:DUF4350 domain-containing protein n=1 Tax=Microcoleus sp. FACHB-672 TaxID=2692825 RepID=UPI0016896020|nr:DUF4350 domain-containing protein [Microcoleus sp. FACHB-672]MBD2043042.1 DUF4350 domain-containing protein [Microcoleus sp. FACHB-672]